MNRMRTRGDCKRGKNSSGTHDNISKQGVNKLLRHVNTHGSSGKWKQDNDFHQRDSIDTPENGPKRNEKEALDIGFTSNAPEVGGCGKDVDALLCSGDEMDDSDWEDCPIPVLDNIDSHPDDYSKGLTIEFSELPDSLTKRPTRGASAKDKELAGLVHKVHLLCLLARGRIIDNACDDPLIQASLLSLLPSHLLRISGLTKLTASALSPVINWFHDSFHIISSASARRSFQSALAFALESREGTSEELAALSVALFRALKLTTRFVSILDVASLKPDADKSGSRSGEGIFNTSTLMVTRQEQVSTSPVKSFLCNENTTVCDTSLRGSSRRKDYPASKKPKDSSVAGELIDRTVNSLACKAQYNISEACSTSKSTSSKRKGDLEFEMQLKMALSATDVGTRKVDKGSDVKNLKSDVSDVSPSFKRIKRIQNEDPSTSSQGISTAIGSKKVGSPLFWAEVYCNGENLEGKWVHVDAINAIIDGEEKVEAAAAACKTSLRYVVAFAGGGAKDVTRRYCKKWHKIASKRVNSLWWDAVLAPLRQLESGATGGAIPFEEQSVGDLDDHEKSEASRSDSTVRDVNLPTYVEAFTRSSFVATRSMLEDIELETRALTEPLPTNQLAYKNHELYAIERWLKKYEILHPKGPVLGFCSGHPVYPRTCVQTLRTKERWLREGLQVKANELPAKVLKRSSKLKNVQFAEVDDCGESDSQGSIELYGKWQLEPLRLPRAVNGIVPKNERGQVEVWSEKCLPLGTVHLRLPRIFYVAKRLDIDYAPAMVGFDFKNGRSHPVFDGIVVCSEFSDAILEAYAEEEYKRESEEKKKNEARAISRWYQLLSSILTRQKLNNCYGESLASYASSNGQTVNNKLNTQVDSIIEDNESQGCQKWDTQGAKLSVLNEDHEHVFLKEDQSFDEETSLCTKRCRCGFSVQVEEL